MSIPYIKNMTFDNFKKLFIDKSLDDNDIFKMPCNREINDTDLHILYDYYIRKDIDNFMTEWLRIRKEICGININFNFFPDKSRFIHINPHDVCGDHTSIFLESIKLYPNIPRDVLREYIRDIGNCFYARCEITKNIIINDEIRYSRLFEGEILIKKNLDDGHIFQLLKLGAIYSIYSFLLSNYEKFNFTSVKIEVDRNITFNIYIKSNNNVIYYFSPYLLMSPFILNIEKIQTIRFHNTYTCVLGNYFSTYWKRIFNAFLVKNKHNLSPNAYKIKYINIRIFICKNVKEILYEDYILTYNSIIDDNIRMINRNIILSPYVGFIYDDTCITSKYTKKIKFDTLEDIYKFASNENRFDSLGVPIDTSIAELPEYDTLFYEPVTRTSDSDSDSNSDSDSDHKVVCCGAGCVVPSVSSHKLVPVIQNEYYIIDDKKIQKGKLSDIDSHEILELLQNLCYTQKIDIITDELDYLQIQKNSGLKTNIIKKIQDMTALRKIIINDFIEYKNKKIQKIEIQTDFFFSFNEDNVLLLSLPQEKNFRPLDIQQDIYDFWIRIPFKIKINIIINTLSINSLTFQTFPKFIISKIPLGIVLRLFMFLCLNMNMNRDYFLINDILYMIDELSEYNIMAPKEAIYEETRMISSKRCIDEENTNIGAYTNPFLNKDYILPSLDIEKNDIIIKFYLNTKTITHDDKIRIIYKMMTAEQFKIFIDKLKEELIIHNVVYNIELENFYVGYNDNEIIHIYNGVMTFYKNEIDNIIDTIICDIKDENLTHALVSVPSTGINKKGKGKGKGKKKKIKYLSYKSKYLKYKTKYLNYKKMYNL